MDLGSGRVGLLQLVEHRLGREAKGGDPGLGELVQELQELLLGRVSILGKKVIRLGERYGDHVRNLPCHVAKRSIRDARTRVVDSSPRVSILSQVQRPSAAPARTSVVRCS